MNFLKVKIGEVFSQIRNGVSIKQKDGAGGIPITRIETISKLEIDRNKFGYADVFDDHFSNFYLKNGDILMSHINSLAHLGKSAIACDIDEKIIHGMNLLLLKADEKYLFSKFSWYYFNSSAFKDDILKISNQSVNQCSFSLSKLKELQIPLPPLATQKRIAEILDAADALRRKDQELLKKYDELAQAIFIDMFGDPVKNEKGWEELTCVEVFDMKLGKMLSAKNFKGTHLKKYLRNVNVKWGKIDFTDLNEMDFTDEECLTYNLKKGDILVCEGGEVGRTSVFQEYTEPIYFQNAIHRLRIKNEKIMNALYFEKYMEIAISKGLIRKETISVTIQHFSLEKFRKLKIIIPPIGLQEEFTRRMLPIRSQINLLNNGSNINLFKSLIQKAFKGELVA